MKQRFFCLMMIIAAITANAGAQKVVYSEVDHSDLTNVGFNIIGKLKGHYLVYKSSPNINNYIAVFDGEMKMQSGARLGFLPNDLLGIDVIAYHDFFYFFYQYQRRNIVYCMAAKIDADGVISGSPQKIDSSLIRSFARNKIYTIVSSEDKQRILVFKTMSASRTAYVLTSFLFDAGLKLVKMSASSVPVTAAGDFFAQFAVDNDGDAAFLRVSGSGDNDNSTSLTLIIKYADSETAVLYPLDVNNLYLAGTRLTVDNYNRHYVISSFFSNVTRGNIEGLYCTIWDKKTKTPLTANDVALNENLRNSAITEGNPKKAFNNFYQQHILMKRDGGFLVISECVYNLLNNGGSVSRWDYTNGASFWRPSDYYIWSSPSGYYFPWWNNNFLNTTRYFTDNVAILSFDASAKMQWADVLHKLQYDAYKDYFLGFGTFNTGDEVHFIYNQEARHRQMLTDQSLTTAGDLHAATTFKTLDEGYQFMPHLAKQVSANELIVPCQYRSYVCFARIEF